MNQEELEILVTRLLDTKSITAKEAIELLKLAHPKTEYIYVDRPVYYRDWTYGYPVVTWANSNNTTAISNTNV